LRLIKIDHVLFEKLKNRYAWTVSTAQMAVELFRELPGIRNKTTSFTFENFKLSLTLDKVVTAIKEVLRWLRNCPNLKFLRFRETPDAIPLSILRRARNLNTLQRKNLRMFDLRGFDSLEHLEISDVCDYTFVFLRRFPTHSPQPHSREPEISSLRIRMGFCFR